MREELDRARGADHLGRVGRSLRADREQLGEEGSSHPDHRTHDVHVQHGLVHPGHRLPLRWTDRRSIRPSGRRSAEQSGHPPVGQHGAVRLARRAVHDLVGLETDPPQIVPASRARIARASVHREALAHLRGQPSGAPALAIEGGGEHRRDGGGEPVAFLCGEVREPLERGQPRLVEDVVGEPAADPRDRPLVA